MNKNTKIKIAILGSRGIPAEFGGFETFAEELSKRLLKKGFSITVFCEDDQSYKESSYKGIDLTFIPTPKILGLRSIWVDSVSIIKSISKFDIIYMLGYHAAFFFILPRIMRKSFWINMDGLEWWSYFPKLYLKVMERLAVRLSSVVVADSDGIAKYIQKKYKIYDNIITIPYGAYLIDEPPETEYIKRYGLDKHDYYLVVCRLEPENHVYEIIRGFSKSSSKKMLVIIGNHKSGTRYVKTLTDIHDERILFIGGVYNKKCLQALRYYCYAYLHGHSVGGTNPSLLEAMGCRNFVIAHDNVFNREVTDGAAWYFKTDDDIKISIERLEAGEIPKNIINHLKHLIIDKYNWDNIADQYEELIMLILQNHSFKKMIKNKIHFAG